MHRSQRATVAALTATVLALAGGALTLPATATAATSPRSQVATAAGTTWAAMASSPTATVAPTGVTWSTTSTWTWAHRGTATATSADQFAQGTISGASTDRRKGAFVLRRTDWSNQVIASFSGTRYQVRSFNDGRETLVLDKAFTPTAGALARVELRGSTLTATYGGRSVATVTNSVLGKQTGRSTGVSIWQDQPSVVTVRSVTSGTLGTTTTPAPAPTTTAPAPAPTTTAPTPAPTTTAPAPAPTTTAPAPAPTTTAPAPAPTTTAPTPAPTTTAPAPAPTAPAPAPGASWMAPALVNPLVWTPSATQRIFKAPADRDVLIRWPATPLDVVGGFELNGGRNVVSTGGTIEFSKRHFPAGADQANNNRCLYITGNATAQKPRTVHVEGLHCAGAYVWEGINVDSKGERGNLTVQFRDITIDGVNVDLPGGTGKHYGGDALQVWNGPHRLRVDGFRATNLKYQGFFLQPNSFGSGPLGRWELNDVYLQGASTGSGYLLWLAGNRTGTGAIDIGVNNFHVRTSPGRSAAQTVWDLANDWPDLILSRG